MSLCCSECNTLLGRSDTLPGREGGMVHPTIIGLAYEDSDANARSITYRPTFIESDKSIAVCLGCIERKLPEERRKMLYRIYRAYEMEMGLAEQTNAERGKWLRHDYEPRFCWEDLSKERESIPEVCIFTGKPLDNDRPFFTVRMIDRVNSVMGSGMLGSGNYQWSCGIKRSGTGILISFDAFREHFPSQFRELGCQLRGVENTRAAKVAGEIIIDSSFKDAVEKETGKSMDQIIQEKFVGKGLKGVTIVYSDKPGRCKSRS